MLAQGKWEETTNEQILFTTYDTQNSWFSDVRNAGCNVGPGNNFGKGGRGKGGRVRFKRENEYKGLPVRNNNSHGNDDDGQFWSTRTQRKKSQQVCRLYCSSRQRRKEQTELDISFSISWGITLFSFFMFSSLRMRPTMIRRPGPLPGRRPARAA